MGEIFNIDPEIPIHLKHQYQEGTATGLTVTGLIIENNHGLILFSAERKEWGSEGGNYCSYVQVPIHVHFDLGKYAFSDTKTKCQRTKCRTRRRSHFRPVFEILISPLASRQFFILKFI